MNKVLSLSEAGLLREVVIKHQPSLISLLDSIGQTPLTVEQRENLREAISDEFVETGIDENDEPNERGLLLESLIDRLGHF